MNNLINPWQTRSNESLTHEFNLVSFGEVSDMAGRILPFPRTYLCL